MIDSVKKNLKTDLLSLNHAITEFIALSFFLLTFAANAQTDGKQQSDDATLLDSFIQGEGYTSSIVFSPKNIKQFWIEKSVVSHNDSIIVFTEGGKSTPYKIQLANVNETLDCRVEIFSNTPDLSFIVLNDSLKAISESSSEDKFINYSAASASFHLDNTKNLSFYLQFVSSKHNELDIKRIVLSFSTNKETSFLASPGTLVISDSNCSCLFAANVDDTSIKALNDKKCLVVKCKRSGLISNNKILVSDNTISSSVKIKNVGDQPTQVSIGYAVYSKDGKRIDNRVNPYIHNRILKVVSAPKNSNKIIVDIEPEWKSGCVLALNAKENLSDFPNTSCADGTIQDVVKNDAGQFEIIFDKEQKNEITAGTQVRVQAPAGSSFVIANSKKLLPNEEATLQASLKQNNDLTQYNTKTLCRGSYYIIPLLRSYSEDTSKYNEIQIDEYILTY